MDTAQPSLKALVVAGPSGVGKGTLLNMLRHKYANRFEYSISHTSRPPRHGESHGCQYYFGAKDDLLRDAADGKFLEHALIYGNFYGTSRAEALRIRRGGRICLLEVDVQGITLLQQNTEFAKEAFFVFIQPPSIEELAARLKCRGTETEEKRALRVEVAAGELEAAKALTFDRRLTNESLEVAFSEFENIMGNLYPALSWQKE